MRAADLGAARRATLSGDIVPVLAGAAFRNKGVQPLIDAVVAYLPSPKDVPPLVGQHPETEAEELRQVSDKEPLAAYVFKILTDAHG